MKRLLAVAALVLAAAISATAAARAQDGEGSSVEAGVPEAAGEEPFAAWLADFRGRAIASGRPVEAVDAILGGLEPHALIIELDHEQPEFVRPIWEYLDSAVSASRVEAGRTRMADAADLFDELEARYRVDREYLIAIWGLESAFGAVIGDFDAARSIATLAWEGRRRELFESELLIMIDLVAAGEAERSDFISGWAGAMGQTQFMPSTFQRYAVDHDGDGRKDIWRNRADALASAAYYLADHGWRAGEPWGVEVETPDDFDFAAADGRRRSVAAWAMEGVVRVDGAPWSPFEQFMQAKLLLPAGAGGPAFLTFSNFEVFRRYNNATSYALAAGLLGDAIAGKAALASDWPRHERPLTRVEVMELQRLLNQLDYATQGIDGLVGPNTRAALREFQADREMPADAFATAALLERARADVAAANASASD